MAESEVLSTNVDEFKSIHPALDFWDNNAIVSVGGQWMDTTTKTKNEKIITSISFHKRPTCILSNGDVFPYSNKTKAEFAKRKLFFTGSLDIPIKRWANKDVEDFKKTRSVSTFNEVFKLVRVNIMYYLDVSDDRIHDLLTCFIMFTYFYPIFNTSPILHFFGEYGTGKTRMCDLLQALAFNPINSSNISSATIFRIIESRRATVLLDESEDLSNTPKGKEITNMLLAGTGKGGEVFRQQKNSDDSYDTTSFQLFSPKVIANITGIDLAPMLSRIIRITMLAIKPDKNLADREIDQEDLNWTLIRDQLYRLCLVRFKEVIQVKENLPEHGLSARNLGIWKGILTIASLVDEEVWKSVLSYAHKNKEVIEAEIANNQDDSKGLLVKVLSLMNGMPLLTIRSEDLMNRLAPNFYFTTLKDMSNKLSKYDLHTKDVRVDNKTYRGYVLNKDFLANLLQTIR
jgi:hypothetical protein